MSLLDSHNLKLLPLLILAGLLNLDLVQKFGLLRELLSEQSFLRLGAQDLHATLIADLLT